MKIKTSDIKIVLFLSGQRGLEVLKKLTSEKYDIIKIIVGSTDDYQLLNSKKEIDVEIAYEKNVNDNLFVQNISNLNVDYFVMSGFKQILKKEILNIPKKGTLNLHAGKLPEYRGGSPLNWQIINGEKYAYISTILTDEGIDTGNVLSEEKIEILETDDIRSLHEKVNKLFPNLLIDSLLMIEMGNYGTKQNEEKASYWHQRNDDDGFVEFRNSSSDQINRTVKALTLPYPCAWGLINNEKVRIIKAEVSKTQLKGSPGKIVYISSEGPYVICKEGSLKLLDYKFENDKKRKITKNDRFL